MSRPSFLIRGLSVVYIVATEKSTNAKRNAQRLGSLVQSGIISAYEDYETYEEDLEPEYYIDDADTYYDWFQLSDKEQKELAKQEAMMFDDYGDDYGDDYWYDIYDDYGHANLDRQF